jgi:hypothetical protein
MKMHKTGKTRMRNVAAFSGSEPKEMVQAYVVNSAASEAIPSSPKMASTDRYPMRELIMTLSTANVQTKLEISIPRDLICLSEIPAPAILFKMRQGRNVSLALAAFSADLVLVV